MVRLVGLEPTTGKTPVDFKPTAYANFATAAPATRPPENTTLANARNAPPSSPPKAGGKSVFSSLHLPASSAQVCKIHFKVATSGLKMHPRLAEEFRAVQ